MSDSVQVLLVVPPVLYPGIPTLGPSILAPACRALGVSARVHYANLSFAARFGFEVCTRFAASRTLVGEAIFLGVAFPERADEVGPILDLLQRDAEGHAKLRQIVRLDAPEDAATARCVAELPDFVAQTAAAIVARGPRIVGFSTMVQQTMASIALARAVKRLDPTIVTVLGGANAAEPIGSALLELAGVFDYVFSGESDQDFPRFCKAYLDDGTLPGARVIRGRGVARLDAVPAPDYDDYFAELEPLRARDDIAAGAPHFLIFESSRGCWWGDRKNCTFCGYNFPGTGYRAKSPERVVSELEGLIARYGVERFYASDNVMARDFPAGVLEALAARGTPCDLSYEVKSPITPHDLDRYVRAGLFEIQPGIESFSTHILKAMDKGVSGLDNVRLLRDAASRGLHVVWNILTAIPGERNADYEAMLRLLPLLEHLRPPTRWGPIRISRYSPYHDRPEAYGITGLQPWEAYHRLFGAHAERVAMHFFGHYTTEFLDTPELVARLDRAVADWTEAWYGPNPPMLALHRLSDGSAEITDTRRVAVQALHLLAPEAVRVLDSVAARPTRARRVPEADRAVLDALAASGFVAFHEDRYLAVVTEPALGTALMAERERGRERRLAGAIPGIAPPGTPFIRDRSRPIGHGDTLRI